MSLVVFGFLIISGVVVLTMICRGSRYHQETVNKEKEWRKYSNEIEEKARLRAEEKIKEHTDKYVAMFKIKGIEGPLPSQVFKAFITDFYLIREGSDSAQSFIEYCTTNQFKSQDAIVYPAHMIEKAWVEKLKEDS